MKLRYITCSDPREHNSIESILKLARMSNAEIAVQCHPSKMSYDMPKETASDMHPGIVAQVIHSFPHQEFIFQYNDNTKSAIQKLHKTNAKFSLLFDASGGRGVAPKPWEKPIYETHPMGYSGGMSPDNVIGNLRQINKILPNDYPTWIDAEGKLKSNDLFDEKPKFNTELARAYITRANMWKKQNER